MADFDLPMKLVSSFIFGILPEKKNLVLVMDRKNWNCEAHHELLRNIKNL